MDGLKILDKTSIIFLQWLRILNESDDPNYALFLVSTFILTISS